jgi:hypothetical protein
MGGMMRNPLPGPVTGLAGLLGGGMFGSAGSARAQLGALSGDRLSDLMRQQQQAMLNQNTLGMIQGLAGLQPPRAQWEYKKTLVEAFPDSSLANAAKELTNLQWLDVRVNEMRVKL